MRAAREWLEAHPYVLACAVAAFGYVALAPWGHLFGTGGEYAHPTGDLAQGMTGAFAYIDDEWRWPLFETKRLAWPDGANIVFLDSIPIAALFFKVVDRLSGVRVAYQGIWFALVWFGQASCGVFLLRGLGVKRWTTTVVGALVFLTLPPFLFRHGHLALSGHFAILFALGVYFRMTSNALGPRLDRLAPWLIALLVWIHFYLFVMSAAIYVAALLDARRNHQRSLIDVVTRAAPAFGFALLLMWTGGFFGYSSHAGGFGIYSMNLLSPWAPQGSGWLGGPTYFDGTGGQSEGFQYLGLGVLLAALPMIAGWRARRMRTRRYLAILCVLLTLFALSNHVYWGEREILTIRFDTDVFPFSTFRSSGRFFWPVAYLAVAVTLSRLEHVSWWSSHPNAGVAALVAVAFVQLVDVRHFVVGLRGALRGASENVETPALTKLYEAHDVVHVAPKFACASRTVQPVVVELIYVAAKAGRVVDDVYTSRSRAPAVCEPELVREDDGRRHLYVGVGQVAVSEEIPADEFCRNLGALSVCSRSVPALSLLSGATAYELPVCRDHMPFSEGSPFLGAELAGWSGAERWGTWSVAKTAVIECRLDSPTRAVSITAQGFAPDTGVRRVDSSARGGGATTVLLPHMAKTSWKVPLGSSPTLMLTLGTSGLVSPASRGLSHDERELGVGLMSIDLIHDGN